MRKSASNELQAMILWCRRYGVAWQSLTVGGITIEGNDLRMADDTKASPDRAEPKPSIFKRYGAALLEEAAQSDGMSSVVEMDD